MQPDVLIEHPRNSIVAVAWPDIDPALVEDGTYMRPWDAAGPHDPLGRARRVVRWPRSNRADEVIREQVRRLG
jgi:hypothetical protein